MIGMVRLAVFGFLALAVVFILVSIYSKSIRREKLENKWDEEVKTGDRDAYVKAGLQDYDSGWRKQLLWLIFIVPVIIVLGLIYLTNFS